MIEALRKSDLSRRLTVAILTPVLLLLLVGGLLALQITRMADDARWLDHSDEAIARIYELQAEVLGQESALRGFLATGDRSYLQGYVDARPLVAIASLRGLVAGSQAQESRLEAVAQAYDAWLVEAQRAARPELRAQEESFERAEARRHRHDQLGAAILSVLAAEQDLRHVRTLAASASLRATWIGLVAVLAGLALTLAFSSRRQLRAIAASYGDALESERSARVAVEDQDWARTGHLALSDAMQGDMSIDQLSERILEAIGSRIGAEVGAVFTQHEGTWTRRAGYGLDPRVAGPQSFGSGEGLVGRAASQGRLLHLRDVPEDYLRIRSGIGSRSPVEIVLLPAQTERIVHAVVEFGFLRPAPARALDLLTRVAENIATAVRSAEYRARLRELLERSQQQAQELRAQQEELRVANEELQEQRNALGKAHAELEERQEELQAFNSRLEEQASELLLTRDALVEKAAEAERASRYKSQFLANMSHELRTPLNSSLILAKLLADNREGNLTEEQVRFARTIHAAGNDLLTLISDILDLAKIEAGRIDLHESRVHVGRLAESLAGTCEPVARDKGIGFAVHIDEGAPEAIETDGQRLEQILRNLLSNALKFTEKGAVSLRISQAGEHVRFAVEDSGIGIAQTQQSAIFEAFRQGDGTSHRRFGGAGLGLAISRDLARRLGGEIQVDSEPGRGSVFLLTMPIVRGRRAPAAAAEAAPPGRPRDAAGPSNRPAAPAAAALPARSAPPDGSRGLLRTLPGGPAGGPDAPQAPLAPAHPIPDDRDRLDRSRHLVLVVEDDERFAAILIDLAHELGFQCIVAHEADAGVALAGRYLPNAVVLDVNLPDHSGLSMLDRIKHNPSTRHIPVHVVSVEDHAQVALSMGAVGYLVKPVDRDALTRAFRKLEERLARPVRRLLVVEDDPVQRDSLARLLSGPDVELSAVGSVRDALAALASATFDCAVTDLALPDATGFDLLARMAEDGRYPFPPVIVYTGRSLTPEEEQLLRRYSSSIIVKGARSPERLLDEVTLFLHRVESDLPAEQQRMLKRARDREAVFEGRRVLIVEDDVRNIYALSSVLEPKGAVVLIARNGREAIELLDRTPDVDLVLMDIMMPEMDGIQAMREIRKRPGWAKLPIVALTAKAMKDDQDRCREAGANDYISKPLDVDKLLSLLRVWMTK